SSHAAARLHDAARVRRARRPAQVWALAAAAGLLIVSTALVTRWTMLRDATPAVTPPTPVAATAPLAQFERAERDYMAAIADLERVLEREEAALPPGAAELLRSNLDVIDRALAEARAALAHSPESAGLTRSLLAAYEQKLGLLRSTRESLL
ncbi:MAG: hypothetical protein ACRELD_14205, partial [Longimicrobiales bacterium]